MKLQLGFKHQYKFEICKGIWHMPITFYLSLGLYELLPYLCLASKNSKGMKNEKVVFLTLSCSFPSKT